MITDEKELLSRAEVAEVLGVSVRYVYNLIQAGELKLTKIGRGKVARDTLMEFIRNREFAVRKGRDRTRGAR